MIFMDTVYIYPSVSRLEVAVLLCCVLTALCNATIISPRFKKKFGFVVCVTPFLLLVLTFFTPALGRLHKALGWNYAPLQKEYFYEFIAGYIYMAFGFGLSLSSIRQHQRSRIINGIVFLLIFAYVIFLCILDIVELNQFLARRALEIGYPW